MTSSVTGAESGITPRNLSLSRIMSKSKQTESREILMSHLSVVYQYSLCLFLWGWKVHLPPRSLSDKQTSRLKALFLSVFVFDSKNKPQSRPSFIRLLFLSSLLSNVSLMRLSYHWLMTEDDDDDFVKRRIVVREGVMKQNVSSIPMRNQLRVTRGGLLLMMHYVFHRWNFGWDAMKWL